jgi:DNA-binding response OmpR family regulator
MRQILFVDNDPYFLETRSEFLERVGYKVVKATSVAAAERCLREIWTPVAILDIRLSNDDDEKDRSGVALAKSDLCRSVTKIILTNFPSTDIVRELLEIASGNRTQIAVDVLSKQDGPNALINAVQTAFTHHIRINWSLAIDWKATTPPDLARRIEPGVESERERLLNRAEEMEDLFRRLFYEKDHLQVERLLWQREGRAALVVFAFKEGAKPESFVVVCGENSLIRREAQRFDEFAPKAAGDSGTILHEAMRAETTHFAANAYTLTGNDLESVQTLFDLYRSGPEKTFNAVLSVLYQETLKAWHQDKSVPFRAAIANGLYTQRLRLAGKEGYFEERFRAVETQSPRLGVNIERKEDGLAVHFKQQSFQYANPLPLLLNLIASEQTDFLVTTPGTLSGENILTDGQRAWLTDFAGAGLAPSLWNFVTLEAAIRFDWVETKEVQRRLELEKCLIFTDFARPDTRDLEPSVRKVGRTVSTLRKLAARTVGRNDMEYQRGMFFHAASRLADFNPASPLKDMELARLAHIVISLSMLAAKIRESQNQAADSALGQMERIRIADPVARKITVGKREIKLTAQEFRLFDYLFQNANRVCTKEELIRNVLKDEHYSEDYLSTLIRRVRRAIGDDPKEPRFVITEAGVGYRLNNPE